MSAALLENFNLLAASVGGVARLRELILSLAVRGRLVPQDPEDEPASELLKRIRAEKDRLIKAGRIRRDKPLPSISDEETPYDLPKGWEWVRTYQAAESRLGKMLDKAKNSGSAYPYLRNTNVQWQRFELDDVKEIFLEPYELDEYLLKAGDLLICEGGEPGRCAIWRDEREEMYFQKALHRMRTLGGVLPEYIAMCLQADALSGRLEKFFTGATIKHFAGQELNRYFFALPPVPEQSRIVAKVEELMALCDRLEAEQGHAARVHGHWVDAALDQLAESADADEFRRHWQHLAAHFDTLFTTPESIDRLDATLLQLAVRGKLVPQDPNDEPASELLKQIRAEKDFLIKEGKVKRDKPLPPVAVDERPYALPAGWEWVRFDEIITPQKPISYGVLVPGPDEPNGIPFVRLGDLSLTAPPTLPEKSIAKEVDAQYERTRLEGGEILMGVVGSIGKLGVAPTSWRGANIARAVCRIVPMNLMSKEFVVLLLKSDFMQASFVGDTRTVAQPTLNVGLIRSAMTPLPGRAEQSRIVAQLEKLQSLTASLKARITAAQTKQAHLAEALIAEVV